MRKHLLLPTALAGLLLFSSVATASAASLNSAQVGNLHALVREGRAEQRPQLLIVSAIDTAYTETLLTNKNIRDQDGRPLFSGIFGLIPGAWGLYPAQQRMPRIVAGRYYARAGTIHRLHPDLGAGELSQRVMQEPWTQAYIFLAPIARNLYLQYG